MSNFLNCSPPSSSVHGISQTRIMEWVAISFSRGSSWPRNLNPCLLLGRWIFYHLSHQGSPVGGGQRMWFHSVLTLGSCCWCINIFTLCTRPYNFAFRGYSVWSLPHCLIRFPSPISPHPLQQLPLPVSHCPPSVVRMETLLRPFVVQRYGHTYTYICTGSNHSWVIRNWSFPY